MSTIISVFRCKILYVSYFLFFLLITDVFGQTQQFFLLGKEYRFKNGKWYTLSFNGNLGDPIVPYSLIVRLKDRGYLETFDFSQLNIDGISLDSKRILEGFYVLSISQEQNPFNVASILEESDKFDVMEFDVIGERLVIPNDPLYDPHQWNLKPSHLDMPAAWEITTGDPSIILAVIDSGTEYVHEDLDGNIWINDGEDDGDGIPEFFPISQGGDIGDLDGDGDPDDDGNVYIDDLIGWDFAGGGYDPQPPFVEDNDPDDNSGHGTNVSGIMSAQTNNFENGEYVGIAGVTGGWGVNRGSCLMVLRDGGFNSYANLTAQSIIYASENGAKVINISSGYASNNPYITMLGNAVNTAVNTHNVVIVAAAGNNGDNLLDPSIRYPAKFPNTIAVGATDINDVRRNYSAYGSEMDVMAPDGIASTVFVGSGYATNLEGTSFSAPQVAGQAALLLSFDPSFSWQQVRDFIRYSTDKVSGMGGYSFTTKYGYGRINVFKSLLRAQGYGHVPTDITLYNDIELMGDLIIDQGATLTVKPGVTLTFAANSDAQNEGIYSTLSELIVKGKVVFEGSAAESIVFQSTSGQPQSWGGIRFEDSSDDFSVITHCQIEDAFIGLHLDRAGTSVNDNTLINNMWGLYLNYSAASINNNLIRDNTSNGLLIYNSNAIEQDVLVENNTIIFNGARGIYGNNSSPIITKNFIKHNNLHGIEGLNQFNAIIGSRAGQDNWISNNSGFGIRIMNASTPFLGNDEESPGQNAVYNNDNAEFYNTGGSICYAQYNYWGADPPEEEEFYTDAASEIIYNPWLSENPMMELKLTKNNSVNS